MPPWVLGIVRIVRPGINSIGLGIAFQVEHLHHSVPNRLSLPNLFYWNTFGVYRLGSMELLDHVPQLFDVGHATASTKSPTLQKLGVTPAAIAGVMRRVLWRLTKL